MSAGMTSTTQEQRVLSLRNPLQVRNARQLDAFCRSGGSVLANLLMRQWKASQ